MSRPVCENCGEEMTRTEAGMCEICQHFFCFECLPQHSPCAVSLAREVQVGVPEQIQSRRV